MNLLVINTNFIEILIFNYDYKYLCFYSSEILLMTFTVSAQNHILTSLFQFPLPCVTTLHSPSLNTHCPLAGRCWFMLMNPMKLGLTRVYRGAQHTGPSPPTHTQILSFTV